MYERKISLYYDAFCIPGNAVFSAKKPKILPGKAQINKAIF
jgi:hypothetical protein